MSERAIEQRIWLTRRLYSLPALRKAMRDGRVSYEKARLVARIADESTLEAWIVRAVRTTCLGLRREIEADEDTQTRARAELSLRVPRHVRDLLSEAVRAVRDASDRWLDSGECLVRMAEHFIDTWKPLLAGRSTRHRKVLARDRGLCTVPACSRAAGHAHHLRFRSLGGDDDPANLSSLCVAHHLHGVHSGYIRATGRAPDGILWEMGLRPGLPPLWTVFSGPVGRA